MEASENFDMRKIVVIGGGIVGVAVAAELAEREFSVVVVEQGSRDRLIGSTGHAPGYIGVFSESPVLTTLAQASGACYSDLSHDGHSGFDQVGGLEIARTDKAMNDLVRRAAKAKEAGLQAQLISASDAVALAPKLIDDQHCVGAVLYAADGTARAAVIASALRERSSACPKSILSFLKDHCTRLKAMFASEPTRRRKRLVEIGPRKRLGLTKRTRNAGQYCGKQRLERIATSKSRE
jgi:glycine/D-amino acid oxidase-like deaminating enzyme